jgi:hypothetical protein
MVCPCASRPRLMVVIRIVDVVIVKRKGRTLSLKENAKFVVHLSMCHKI